jgi:hypothetical protein
MKENFPTKKHGHFLQAGIALLIIFSPVLFHHCTQPASTSYQQIKDTADAIRVINTHEHQHWPEEIGDFTYRFYHLIHFSYLISDIVSAGGTRLEAGPLDSLSLEDHWKINGKALDNTRNTSYYSHFIKGFRKLYDFDDLYFTQANIPQLSAQIEKNYRDYRSWFDSAFQKAGFELMFLDQYWKPFNTEIDERYFALVFNINELVLNTSSFPAPGDTSTIYHKASREGYPMQTLDEYLTYCDHLFLKNIEHKAVCLKNTLAYSRALDFEEVPYETARALYGKRKEGLNPVDSKQLQDFLFHWIIQRSIEYELPIQIHTGYLAGNGNYLENGRPVKLNNLFMRYPEARFVLFHGGYPWTGEYAALGKMFPNVYLDMVWLPQISREKAVLALDEMFDCVPCNKFFWGGDCGLIEESVGSLEYGKEVLAEVLARRIGRGLLTEDVACDIVRKVLRENAIEFFRLEERLGRSL